MHWSFLSTLLQLRLKPLNFKKDIKHHWNYKRWPVHCNCMEYVHVSFFQIFILFQSGEKFKHVWNIIVKTCQDIEAICLYYHTLISTLLQLYCFIYCNTRVFVVTRHINSSLLPFFISSHIT